MLPRELAPSSSQHLAIGLGANLGGDAAIRARFRDAIIGIASYVNAARVCVSGLYSTAPVGPIVDQPRFFNAVATFTVDVLEPRSVMIELLRLERVAGRRRDHAVAKGPRVLDLDLLLAGTLQVADSGPPAVRVPHPEMAIRRFVLAPLAELVDPEQAIPGAADSIASMLRAPLVADQCIERIADASWYGAL